MSHFAGWSRGEIEIHKGVAGQKQLAHPGEILDEHSNPFPPTLVLAPLSRRPTTLPEATLKSVLSADPARIQLARYDVICFSGVDWDSKQLQWVMTQFARHNHRVFYLRPDPFLPPDSPQAFYTRTVAPNLFETRVVATRHTNDVYGEVIDPEDASLLKALEALRSAYEIDAAVAYVELPFWNSVAMRTRERWGWKVVYDCTLKQEDTRFIGRSLLEREQVLKRKADLVIGSGTILQNQNNNLLESSIAPSRQPSRAEYWRRLDRAIRATFKRASIVIVTFNNLLFTRLCLESLLANTEYPNYEVIVVDNGSTDGTPAYLRSMTEQYPHVRAVFNADNLGFASANNQGLAMATGDVLVLLNNDTIVPRGWLTRLVWHLEDPSIGLVGPVTNRIGNEAQIEISYRTYARFKRFAKEYTQAREGQLFDVRTLMMFCVAMRRNVYERIGSLDERFEVGTFEDDDYALRVRSAGYRVVGAEDVFVQHFGEASFGKLAPSGEYAKLLQANRRRFEEKWGITWEPHQHRLSHRYKQLIGRIREVLRTALPPSSTVVVVSRGDDELLRLDGKQTWHFPQSEDGRYAGHYPADSAEAIEHLERLRIKGAEFLLFPETAFWWLEHYSEFEEHLGRCYGRVWENEHCLIFDLRELETESTEEVVEESGDASVPSAGMSQQPYNRLGG